MAPSVVIVSPALADANNGNWQTARRWVQFLADRYAVRVVRDWPDAGADADRVMIALHAKKSAAAIDAWARRHPGRGMALVLTGTDLYGDIARDPVAQRSLAQAQRLVVLQPLGLLSLPLEARARAESIYQSVEPMARASRPAAPLRAVVVGHLRAVKDPQTVFDAAARLHDQPGIAIDHIGGEAEPGWGDRARTCQSAHTGYRWLGARPHDETRDRIAAAHVLIHPSRMEGGAHVVMEAACSGTAVLASRIPGNVGMLGEDYAGYFEPGDAAALASLLVRCRDDLAAHVPAGSLLAHLGAQCEARAPLFEPGRERAALVALVERLQEAP